MSEPDTDIEAIFHGALALRDSSLRAAYLDNACGDDADLRRRVEALMEAHQGAGSFLGDSPANGELQSYTPPDTQDHTLSLSGRPPDDSSPDQIAQRHLPNIPGYRILGVVGQGGMGIVYRAVQTKLNRTVALKVLPAVIGAANPQIVERFRREAKAAARLHHTNIIPIYDFGESHDAHYFAMELVSGQSLDKVIRRFAEQNAPAASPARLANLVQANAQGTPASAVDGPSPSSSGSASTTGRGRAYYRQVASWMAAAADALHFAHGEGIIHRDIKPGNLILADDGRIMIADFGLAKGSGETSVTMTGALMGTLRYMSPEQAMAKRMRLDHRTDIYSLGATLYELLTFRPAFDGRDDKEILGAIITREPTAPRKIVPGVPRELETICQKMMEKAPEARYDTARALAEDLRRHIHDMPIIAKRPGVVTRSVKFVRRRKAPVIAACTSLLLVLAVGWYLVHASGVAVEQRKTDFKLLKSQMDAGQWIPAEAILGRLLVENPDDVRALIYRAILRKKQYNALGDGRDQSLLHESESFCRKALAIEPDNFTALNVLGVLLKMLGKLEAASDTYRRVIALHPNYPAAWVNLGTIFALQGDLRAADRDLRKATSIDIGELKTVDAWRNLASLQLHQGQIRAAAQNIDMALKCKREDIGSLLLKARLQLATDPDAAVKTAHNADYEAQERDAKVKRVLAQAYLATGQPDAAIASADEALALGDMPAINHLIVAVASARQDDFALAAERAQKARESWPADLQEKGAHRATADKGVLWFDTADELTALRAEVQAYLDGEAP